MPAFPAMCNALLLHLIHIILLSLHWVVHCTIMCYGDRGPLTDTSITLHCSLTLIALPCIEGKWMVLEGGCFLGFQHFALQCIIAVTAVLNIWRGWRRVEVSLI